MAFWIDYSPTYGKQYEAKHRAHAQVAAKIRTFLGLGLYVGVHLIKFEVWEKVVWVHVPGFRPRFISRQAIDI